MRRPIVLFAGLVAVAGGGCARRTVPYQFRAPILGAPEVTLAARPRGEPEAAGARRGAGRPVVPGVASRPPGPPRLTRLRAGLSGGQPSFHGGSAAVLRPRSPAPPAGSASAPGASGRRADLPAFATQRPSPFAAAPPAAAETTADTAEPAPPAAEAPAPAPRSAPPAAFVAATLAAALRLEVGLRDRHATDVDGVRMLLAPLGLDLEIGDGPALVALAQARGALVSPAAAAPRLGDLLVFDAYRGRDPASMLGVVAGVDDRGVVEFLYLGGGVVRRGFLSIAAPTTQRDGAGRIVNTILRPNDGRDRHGTPALAGVLLSGVIRLDALVPRPGADAQVTVGARH